MIRRIFFSLIVIAILAGTAEAQFIKTADLFSRNDANAASLKIEQDPALDTLLSRYILMSNRALPENDNNYGMDGYRIQIYFNSTRNAREESNKVRAEFISRFPDIASYKKYSEPGYFKVRVGDFRTKAEATKVFLEVSRVFPNAYIVRDVINFPELKNN